MKVGRIVERAAHWIGFIGAMIAVAAIVVVITRPAEKNGAQATFAGADQQKKRLAIFLDGTWNTVDTNTNVWRMRALCASKSSDGKPQLIYYSLGVNGILGGSVGQGLDDQVRLAYEWLVENYTEGDEIYIFGFSRGAFAARSLAGLVAIDGLLRAGSPISIAELFDRYKKPDEESIWKLKEEQAAGHLGKLSPQEIWLLKYSQPVDVALVGVWDTVGSIGISKGTIPGISRSSFDYLQTGLRIHILSGYHALAIDEHRKDFDPTLWDVNTSAVVAKPRTLANVEQRWFVGAHANVGGGYPGDLLAQAPLRWMIEKAEAHGLSFRSKVDLDGDALKAPVADSYKSFFHGFYSVFYSPFYRRIGRDVDVRSDGSHANINETIDGTVFDRWRADPTYRPPNLVEWAKRKKVDPAQLKTSVRSDDPRVDVPNM